MNANVFVRWYSEKEEIVKNNFLSFRLYVGSFGPFEREIGHILDRGEDWVKMAFSERISEKTRTSASEN